MKQEAAQTKPAGNRWYTAEELNKFWADDAHLFDDWRFLDWKFPELNDWRFLDWNIQQHKTKTMKLKLSQEERDTLINGLSGMLMRLSNEIQQKQAELSKYAQFQREYSALSHRVSEANKEHAGYYDVLRVLLEHNAYKDGFDITACNHYYIKYYLTEQKRRIEAAPMCEEAKKLNAVYTCILNKIYALKCKITASTPDDQSAANSDTL